MSHRADDPRAAGERPFRAVLNRSEALGDSGLPISDQSDADESAGSELLAFAEPSEDEGDWSIDAIEAAYQRALEAAESADLFSPSPPTDAATADNETNAVDQVTDSATRPPHLDQPAEEGVTGSQELEESAAADKERVTISQIVEAVLFVGGDSLTTKRLCDILGEVQPDCIDAAINQLNELYAAQQRPYEIRLGEGGYRMALLLPFEKTRHRVFGVGPREVKLSQEALEMLAFVAYRQPVTKDAFEETGKKNAAALIRQLVLRELVLLDRSAPDSEPVYRTTSRFLQLFGIKSLRDLPRAEMVRFR